MQWRNEGSNALKKYSSCFMIGDKKETCILETFGQWYVGKKFERGIRSISNVYSLERPFDIVSHKLREYFRNKMGCFAHSYIRKSNTQAYFGQKLTFYFPHGSQRRCATELLLRYFRRNRKNKDNIDIYDFIHVLRSHFAPNMWKVCRDYDDDVKYF